MSVLNKIIPKREKTFKIIIVGAGKVGATLADKLAAEGNDVTIVDKDSNLVGKFINMYDIMGVTGNGSSYKTLIDAGITDADIIIAVTDSDELNLLCCTLAKKVGNCAAIARVRNPDYSEELMYLREKLGISLIINPELEASREIIRMLHFPSAISVNPFAKGTVDMIKFKIPSGNMLCGMKLCDFRADEETDVLICVVERDGNAIIPKGDFILREGDIVSFIAPIKRAYRFFKRIKLEGHRIGSAMIVGGGKTSFYLARQMSNSGMNVTIIESNAERCDELTDLLNDDVIIINGDGTDEELLIQEGLQNTDAFIPLTGIDEQNVVLSLYAMSAAPDIKAVTKINHISFSGVINELALGSVVYPRFLTAEMIRRYVRAKRNSRGSNIETLYRLCDDRVEAIEFKIDAPSDYTDKPIKDLHIKKNVLIGCIIRGGKFFVPTGNDCICADDSVIIVTNHSGFDNICDIFE